LKITSRVVHLLNVSCQCGYFPRSDFFHYWDVIDGRKKISGRLNTKTPFKLGLEKNITDPISPPRATAQEPAHLLAAQFLKHERSKELNHLETSNDLECGQILKVGFESNQIWSHFQLYFGQVGFEPYQMPRLSNLQADLI